MQNGHLSLTQQLEAFRAAFLARLPHAERDRVRPAEAAARLQLNDRPVPRVGEAAPDFALPDHHGAIVRLRDRLDQGPVVVLFVRGAWCPFCTLTLRAYQAALPAIHDSGAELLVITPQPAATCADMAERDLLAFPVLSDHGNQTAHAYGIDFETDPQLRPMLERLGHDLPILNGTGNWTAPLPATFVVAMDGTIALAHVEASNHRRLEPAEAVAALQSLRVTALDRVAPRRWP